MFKDLIAEIKLLRESIVSLKESIDRMSNDNSKEAKNSSDIFKTPEGLYHYKQRNSVPKE